MRSSAGLTGDRGRTRPDTARSACDRTSQNRLLRAAQRGDPTARDRLVRTHLTAVRQIASRYQGLGLPLEDLLQEGALGLLEAIDQYDPRRGASFETYARFRIRRAVRNALTEKGRLIRLPKQIVERRRALDQAEAELSAAASGRTPTPASSPQRPASRSPRSPRCALPQPPRSLSTSRCSPTAAHLRPWSPIRRPPIPSVRSWKTSKRPFSTTLCTTSPRGSARCWHCGSESARSHGRTKPRPDFSTSRPDARRRSSGTLFTDFAERSKRPRTRPVGSRLDRRADARIRTADSFIMSDDGADGKALQLAYYCGRGRGLNPP